MSALSPPSLHPPTPPIHIPYPVFGVHLVDYRNSPGLTFLRSRPTCQSPAPPRPSRVWASRLPPTWGGPAPCPRSQPVVAHDRVQAAFTVLELPAADHVDGVESLSQAEEAAR